MAVISAKTVDGASVIEEKNMVTKIPLNSVCTKKDLLDYGFKKYGTGSYRLLVPLYDNSGRTMIYGSFEIEEFDDYIRFEVVTESQSLYSAFYDQTFSNPQKNYVLKNVMQNLENELHNLYVNKIVSEEVHTCNA